MAGYSSASWAIGVLFSDCITKDTPPPFTPPNTTFGYTPRPARLGCRLRDDPRPGGHPGPGRRALDFRQKKQAHRQPGDPDDLGDAWIWRGLALPSRLRVASHLSHERSDAEARAFLARFKARTDGRAPFFASDQLPAYV